MTSAPLTELSLDTGLLDAMRDGAVERVRFRQSPLGLRILAAKKDGEWTDAHTLLPDRAKSLEDVALLFRLGGHERLDLVFRDEIGLRFLCAVHSTTRGPGAGGLRRHDLVMPERDVIADVLQLSRAMTLKNAYAEISRGGSKLCVHNPAIPDYDRERWIAILAEEIDLSGTITGPDTGFTPSVYFDLAAKSNNVTGYRGGGTAPSAAFGVWQSIRATAAALGIPLSETKIVLQGLGSLGFALGEHLAHDGAKLTVTDRDHRRIDAFLSALTQDERKLCGVVAPYQTLDVEADILAPCAVGGIISASNVSKLKVRAICGGANNQLVARSLDEELDLARALYERGILYIPDWIASAGGTIHGTMELEEQESFDPKKAQARIRRICGWRLDEILEASKRSGHPPFEVALRKLAKET